MSLIRRGLKLKPHLGKVIHKEHIGLLEDSWNFKLEVMSSRLGTISFYFCEDRIWWNLMDINKKVIV